MLVLITGGLSGIGAALVAYYHREYRADASSNAPAKTQVVVLDLPATTALTAQQSAQFADDRLHYIACNIANNSDVQDAVRTVYQAHGAPDLVINCAGILRAGEFSALSATDFLQSYQVNVLGSRHVAAACLPIMPPGSQFALVASMAGTVGIYGYSAYGSSKFAVLGMAQSLRAEYAPHKIAISVICPPEIDTPMVRTEVQTMHPATRILKDMAGRLTLAEALPPITHGLARRQFMIIPGALAKVTFWVNRTTPLWIQHRVIDWLVRYRQ